MDHRNCALIGGPVQSGTSQPECILGTDSDRTVGRERTLRDLGHQVHILGTVRADDVTAPAHQNAEIQDLAQTISWATVAAHFTEGVIALMPISAGKAYGFENVIGRPANMAKRFLIVMAFGMVARAAGEDPLRPPCQTPQTAARSIYIWPSSNLPAAAHLRM